MFSYELCESFKNTVFTEHLRATASGDSQIEKSNNYILGKYIASFSNKTTYLQAFAKIVKTVTCYLILTESFLNKVTGHKSASSFKKGIPAQVFPHQNSEGFQNSYSAEYFC